MCRAVICPLIAALAACNGVIGGVFDRTGAGPGGSDGPGGGGPGGGSDDPAECLAYAADSTPMRLLSLVEYNNTVSDLLADPSAPLDISPTAAGDWFDNNAINSSVSAQLAERYVSVSETLASRAVERLDTLLPCSPAEIGENECARAFIERFTRRAFRRPPTAAEVDALLGVHGAGAAQGGFEEGLRWVLQSVLQSPDFLYHVELGRPEDRDADVVWLTSDEVASRLSYFLWNTMPDEALFAAADRGELDEPGGIAAQAERMLEDPRARASARHFHRQWLELDRLDGTPKDAELFPTWESDRPGLEEEALDFLEDVIWSGGDVATLLLGAGEGGILTEASLLAAHAKFQRSSPVLRGKFVRQRLLCQNLPPPPPDVPPLPEISPDLNERERLAQHREDPACSGCHRLMDPIGLTFEHYDAVGAWRDIDEDGSPIDATGELIGTDVDGPIDGARELSERLAESRLVRACIAKQWFRYAMARVETTADQCNLVDLQARFEASGHRLRDLLIAITQLDVFRSRAVEDRAGGCP